MTAAPTGQSAAEGQGRLVDRFGRRVTYLRLSVTNRCNFRCVYCMPEEGIELEPASELLTFEEIERAVAVLAEAGVRRVRLTGGEPLVRRQLPQLVERLAAVDGVEEVVMTTNGVLLPRYARQLKQAGLSALTVSLDSLRPERFASITRRGTLEQALDGIEAARAAGFEGIKVNTVLIRGFNDDEILELVQWAIDAHLTLRFIEFMPIGDGTVWGDLDRGGCVPAAELRAILGTRFQLEHEGMVAGAGPSRYMRLSGPGVPPGRRPRVGVISAVTECFCDACNRIRMTPQGGLRACLADDSEADLRRVLRGGGGDEALRAAVARALWGKKETHSFDIEGGNVTSKSMVSIGG